MTTVMVVDDHPVFRDGLTALLATVPDVEVVAVAGTAEEALATIAERHDAGDSPLDVVLMDINLPGASGVEATRLVTAAAPATAVLMVTMVDDDDAVYAALAAGARGYVLKDATPEEITAAVATVAAGGAVFGSSVASRLLSHPPWTPPSPIEPLAEPLTPREQDVLRLLADGATNKAIARSLGISLKTVQNHVSRILDKLQAVDRTEVALRARRLQRP